MTRPPDVDRMIDCIDCGGRCHLMVTWADDDPPYPGDIVWYRCEDCHDRWDIVLPEAPETETPPEQW